MKLTDTELDAVLNKLVASTKSPRGSYSANESYKKIEARIHRRRVHIYFKTALKYTAAILVICVSAWGIYQQTKPVEVLAFSTLKNTQSLQLPDGTKIILNHYSTISYPKKFSTNRKVSLKGEAYFEVSKDKKHPFIVTASDINVEVLGTHFNINAYPQNKEIKTTLFEGSVSMSNKENTASVVLKPNETGIYNIVNKSISQKTAKNIDEIIDWQKGLFIFNDLPLYEIAKELSNSFNVTIQISNPSLQKYRLTAKFNNAESITQILETLKVAGNFNYSHKGKIIQITNK